jgi:hypothetical protein
MHHQHTPLHTQESAVHLQPPTALEVLHSTHSTHRELHSWQLQQGAVTDLLDEQLEHAVNGLVVHVSVALVRPAALQPHLQQVLRAPAAAATVESSVRTSKINEYTTLCSKDRGHSMCAAPPDRQHEYVKQRAMACIIWKQQSIYASCRRDW